MDSLHVTPQSRTVRRARQYQMSPSTTISRNPHRRHGTKSAGWSSSPLGRSSSAPPGSRPAPVGRVQLEWCSRSGQVTPQVREVHAPNGRVSVGLNDAPQPSVVLSDEAGRGRWRRPIGAISPPHAKTHRQQRTRIGLRCPTTDQDVPTGIIMDFLSFNRLIARHPTFTCPACGRTHEWSIGSARLVVNGALLNVPSMGSLRG
jgi:hypothetical protein